MVNNTKFYKYRLVHAETNTSKYLRGYRDILPLFSRSTFNLLCSGDKKSFKGYEVSKLKTRIPIPNWTPQKHKDKHIKIYQIIDSSKLNA
tara:strand:+ start:97 stop:366 length:270 start_codon:yes stop_codon:yes gene_type:complete